MKTFMTKKFAQITGAMPTDGAVAPSNVVEPVASPLGQPQPDGLDAQPDGMGFEPEQQGQPMDAGTGQLPDGQPAGPVDGPEVEPSDPEVQLEQTLGDQESELFPGMNGQQALEPQPQDVVQPSQPTGALL